MDSKLVSAFLLGWCGLLVAAAAAERSLQAQHPRPATVPAFRNGDSVVFFGDSITEGGKWCRFVMDYYRARYPDWTIHVANAGIPGDTATRALELNRVERDVLPNHPSVVVMMFGMNDVSRGYYGAATPTEDLLQKRKAALAQYEASVRKMVQEIKSAPEVRQIILVISSPYDETSQSEVPVAAGVNEALARTGDRLRAIAADEHAAIVDLHTPMTALLGTLQHKNPSFSFNIQDRVHPTDAGSLVMAYFFVQTQNLPITSDARIDLRKNSKACFRCTLRYVSTRHGAVSFELTEQGLPTVFDPDTEAALEWVPELEPRSNREEVAVLLPQKEMAKRYALSIDGQTVGQFSADELALGIDLARLRNTPGYQAASAIAARDEQQRSLAHTLREWVTLEYKVLIPKGLQNASADVQKTVLEQWVREQQTSSPSTGTYYAGVMSRGWQVQGHESEISEQIRQLDPPGQAPALRHSIELKPVADQ